MGTNTTTAADFLAAATAAESADQLDAAIRAVPMDLDKFKAAFGRRQDPERLRHDVREALPRGAGKALVNAIAAAVRRLDLAARPRIENTRNATHAELAAALASGDDCAASAALAGAPIDWGSYLESKHGSSKGGLAAAGGVAVVASGCALPGHFVSVSFGEAISRCSEMLESPERLVRRQLESTDIVAEPATDPLALEKFVSAAAAAETLNDLDSAVYSLLPIDWDACQDETDASIAERLPIPMDEFYAAQFAIVRAHLLKSLAPTDEQLQVVSDALKRSGEAGAPPEEPEDGATYTTREALAAAVAKGDMYALTRAVSRLPINADEFTADWRAAINAGVPDCHDEGFLARLIANHASPGWFISAAWAREIVATKAAMTAR